MLERIFVVLPPVLRDGALSHRCGRRESLHGILLAGAVGLAGLTATLSSTSVAGIAEDAASTEVVPATIKSVWDSHGEKSDHDQTESSTAAELDQLIARTLERVRYAVVEVNGGASGVIVNADGIVLTAAHCMSPGAPARVRLEDGRTFRAVGLGSDEISDCGLLRVINPPDDLPWVPMGRSGTLVEGQPVLSYSHPGQSDPDRGGVLRFGRILDSNSTSRDPLGPKTRSAFIRSSALMEPGDSGGPLFDLDGRVIGIHSQISRSVRQNFDVPIDTFHEMWQTLLDGKAFSGPRVVFDAFGMKTSELDDKSGLLVDAVDGEGIAAAIGFREGDVITHVGKSRTRSNASFRQRFGREYRQRPGQERRFTVERDGEPVSITLDLISDNAASIPVSTHGFADEDVRTAVATSEFSDHPSLVAVRSGEDGQTKLILGTVVADADSSKLIVSKSSEVIEQPSVLFRNKVYEAEVIGRDVLEDLVLLRVADLPATPATFVGRDELASGTLIATPLPPRPDRLRDPILGVRATGVFSSRRRLMLGVQLQYARGNARIATVIPGFPFEAAGIEAGDILRRLNDVEIRQQRDVQRVMGAASHTEKISIEIERGDETIETEITPKFEEPTMLPRMPHVADEVPGGLSERVMGFSSIFSHDTLLRPRHCGGPVLDLAGRVLGVNIARASRTQSYALTGDVVMRFVNRMTSD